MELIDDGAGIADGELRRGAAARGDLDPGDGQGRARCHVRRVPGRTPQIAFRTEHLPVRAGVKCLKSARKPRTGMIAG